MIEFNQMSLELDPQIRPVQDLAPTNRKAEFGQFMTPESVAQFMASLFSPRSGEVRLLDAGAGAGALTKAFIERWGTHETWITAYEIDRSLASDLRDTLGRYEGNGFKTDFIDQDFIHEAVSTIRYRKVRGGFTHAILNPPYKKINNGSVYRNLLRSIGLETVNLYTAFVGLAVELMAQGGEIVAIIPRSFCNGPYYKPFREWILAKAALERIHLFHSRTSAFSADGVLQENVIIKLVRGNPQGRVTITTSSDIAFSDLQSHVYPFAEIVNEGDSQRFIHIPTSPTHSSLHDLPLASCSLDEIGLAVSTGPVVAYRLREFLRKHPERNTVPLLYPTHFASGSLEWPRQSTKPNALLDCAETRRWLYPSGFYTVVRRFSSKEERRRIVAHVVDPRTFETKYIGFENHLNVFHTDKHGIDHDVAHGLAVFLNATVVDEYFRRFSGHTQVNATDLRLLRYPNLSELSKLGRWARSFRLLSQDCIDKKLESMDGERKEHR